MTEHTNGNTIASIAITYVKETSRARRERDLAIELLVHSVAAMGQLERSLNDTRERYYALLDARRREKAAA